MDNINNTLRVWGGKIVKALRAALPPGKGMSGFLGQSIGFTINYAGFPIVFELQLADYYKYIDSGRAPGKFPPPEEIANWIKNKQLSVIQSPRLKSIKNKFRPTSILSEQSQIKSLSFLIGRRIAKEGMTGTNFYSNTLNPDAYQELNNNLSAAFKQDVLALIIDQ